MITAIYIIGIIFIVMLIIFFVSIAEEKLYVRKLAKKYTYEQINQKIKNDEQEINNTKYKGAMMETILEHKELWEKIKQYKRTHF